MNQYNEISTLQYMGSKARIISHICDPIIKNKSIQTVVDLFAGTGSVGYALKSYKNVISNDIEYYAYIINQAILNGCNFSELEEASFWAVVEQKYMLLQEKVSTALFAEKTFFVDNVDYKLYQTFCEKTPSVFEPHSDDPRMKELTELVSHVIPGNEPALDFPCLFLTYFANAYFGIAQCCQIDALRSAIEQVMDEHTKNVLLTVLMSVMSAAASTTTHFAQFLKVKSKSTCNNLLTKRKINIIEECKELMKEYRKSGLCSQKEYTTFDCYNLDFSECLDSVVLNKSTLVYADPPYFKEHYSRYYHVLNTLCLYDYPAMAINPQTHELSIGRYREDRRVSDFGKKAIVENANKNVQQQSDSILSALVSNAVGFGYPNGEELQLGVTTQLSIDDQIKNQTQLSYTAGTSKERLPSTYNGLGYKNLIKMEFLLAAFAKKVEKCGDACIPLLFIEEPESHMHPQMQHAFAEYLEAFLAKITSVGIQTLITSHSAHIANTMVFSKIRYAQKTKAGVIYKNLNTFAQENPSNTDFIRKYLTLTKCDLFFADKAIFVEGASERLLLPDMIDKCAKAGDFDSREYKLPAQYYALVEIGGAYAYKFIPFAEFLGIPCLILTDLDSVSGQKGANGRIYYKSVPVSCGETTSNETLKWWVRKNKGLSADDNTQIALTDITSMSPADKTRCKCHIEFQTTENGLCGHSLEEAIRNVNRAHYELGDTPTEDDLEFSGKSKTDFALNLICECEDYAIPAYIKDGLVWLNDQRV